NNRAMRDCIRAWSLAGKPLYAECGGFMYLTEGITNTEDRFFPLAGVYPVRARMKKGRVALGYRQAHLLGDSIFGHKGQALRGHEFHYSEIEGMDGAVARLYDLGDGRREGYQINNTIGGYLHLHFGFSPEAATNFIRFCGATAQADN
ncbi:MAG: cobyrinate a,c-diamide synthase, partial [Desulfobulbaceae bacterium]|nr:cobyrinate a,c-diamide synthase [Desulfobulbaceae bacterium]